MRRVVFACRHNGGCPQMAAAFFDRDAEPDRATGKPLSPCGGEA
jgi:hypothetical protein